MHSRCGETLAFENILEPMEGTCRPQIQGLPVGHQVDGNNRVSVYLAQPTLITRRVAELTYDRFLVSRLYSNAGAVQGGAMVVTQADVADHLPTRDAQVVNPASEFPTVTGREVIPIVAEVRKWGAKGWISDEARDRNDSSLWTNELRRMSNVLVRAVGLSSREILDQGLDTGRVSGRADRLGHPGADPRRFRA